MNGMKLKLRRCICTMQQWFMTPWHRYIMGRRIVHFVHVSKTGGTSVKMALMSFGCKTKTHYFCLHGHGYRLKDVQEGDQAIITSRNESLRDISISYEKKPWAHRLQSWYWRGPLRCNPFTLHTENLTDEFDILKQVFISFKPIISVSVPTPSG